MTDISEIGPDKTSSNEPKAVFGDATGNSIASVQGQDRSKPTPAEPELRARTKSAGVDEDVVKHMVSRFLGWKLPKDFNPDGGVRFHPWYSDSMRNEPSGTNLFTSQQAEAMVRYMLEGLAALPQMAKVPSEAQLHEALEFLPAEDRIEAVAAVLALIGRG